MNRYSLGIDYGTLSARILLVDISNGEEVSSTIYQYPHGEITGTLNGVPICDEYVLQDPMDYIDVIEKGLVPFVKKLKIEKKQIVGIGVDFTSCTMLPIKRDGTPLCKLDEFKNNPHAYVKLWKHHSAQRETEEINAILKQLTPNLLKQYGGCISSQWMLPKILETLHEEEQLYNQTDYFVEACDFVNWYLSGQLVTSRCFAGFKNLFDGQYLDTSILKQIDSRLEHLFRDKIIPRVVEMGKSIGTLQQSLCTKTGLDETVAIASGIIDAHASLLSIKNSDAGKLLLVLGTSSCQIVVSDKLKEIDGICGVVKDGIIPGYYAYEAGQPATGDMFQWLINEFLPMKYSVEASQKQCSIFQLLEEKIANSKPCSHGLVALDWWNGNRSTLNDLQLRGSIIGLGLQTKFEDIYQCLIEATAFGTLMILKQFEEQGIEINEIYACGGISAENPTILQIYADVLGKNILTIDSKQSGCLGSAVLAAVAAQEYKTIQEATNHMGKCVEKVFAPREENQAIYNTVYQDYTELHHYFGHENRKLLNHLTTLRMEIGK